MCNKRLKIEFAVEGEFFHDKSLITSMEKIFLFDYINGDCGRRKEVVLNEMSAVESAHSPRVCKRASPVECPPHYYGVSSPQKLQKNCSRRQSP